MILRILLIASLIGQLALSYHCCGVAVLRPDLVSAGVDAACMSACATGCGDGACETLATAASCRGEPCEEPPPAGGCDGGPCDDADCCGDTIVVCLPLNQKKSDYIEVSLPLFDLVAHPAIQARSEATISHPTLTGRPPPWLKSHHARQAWLSVWVI